MPPKQPEQEDLRAECLAELLQCARQGKDIIKEIIRLQDDQARATQPVKTVSAASISFETAISMFGLRYQIPSCRWPIEEVPEAKGFQLSPCLPSLVDNYSKNFDRSSKAICRTAVDFILNECLTAMKDGQISGFSKPCDQMTEQHSPRTPPPPPPSADIKVFGDISFSHTVVSNVANSRVPSEYAGLVINGRVDRSIGRLLPSFDENRKCQFQPLLLLVTAKAAGNLESALGQLVVYLASIRHQSRLSQSRGDASVFGVATDGYTFSFVTITHDGTLRRSGIFDVMGRKGDMVTVLGCLKYLLEKSASLAVPDVTPVKNSQETSSANMDQGTVDLQLILDDNLDTNPDAYEEF